VFVEQVTGGRVTDPHRQEKAMSMNHDLTTGLARDHQRQMLAEASRQQRHRAPQTPRTATQFIRGLAAAIASARAAAARVPGVALARPPAPTRPAIGRPPATRPPADEATGHWRGRLGHPHNR
jgi:hypothetical protein